MRSIIEKYFYTPHYANDLKYHNYISKPMHYATGEILTPEGFTHGYVAYNKAGIQDIQLTTAPQKSDITGILTPTFINSHTHLGDAFIKHQHPTIPHNLKEVVAPPNGLKHRLLATTPQKTIENGIHHALTQMIETHTAYFCDFREGGLAGLHLIKNVLTNLSINGLILTRPLHPKYNPQEIHTLLKSSDGIGISSISDWDYSQLQEIAQATHKQNKFFALHASEAHRENIDHILNLKPSFLIHMTHATESDLQKVAEKTIPIILCPRSNHHFGLIPNYQLLKKTNVPLLLGTDNAMLASPNILQEMRYLNQQTSLFSLEELLNMITYTPRKALNLDDHIPGLNLPRSFVVLHRESLEPLLRINWLRGKP
jgi:cytosine/adenosine deaminase-related metal-dependent hydrolase